MGNEYGRTVIAGATGRPVMLSADGRPEWKPVGITVDWTTVDAEVAAGTVAIDGTPLAIGDKVLIVGTVMDRITASGKYGPANTNVATVDGREALAQGETFVVNQTVKESELGSNHVPVISGGEIFKARLRVGGADQPTLAQLLAACPRFKLLSD